MGIIEVNTVRSIQYRNSKTHFANWTTKGLLEYVEKKMLEWLAKQRYNSADVRKQFKHTANVLQNCDNPNLHNQKSIEHI